MVDFSLIENIIKGDYWDDVIPDIDGIRGIERYPFGRGGDKQIMRRRILMKVADKYRPFIKDINKAHFGNRLLYDYCWRRFKEVDKKAEDENQRQRLYYEVMTERGFTQEEIIAIYFELTDKNRSYKMRSKAHKEQKKRIADAEERIKSAVAIGEPEYRIRQLKTRLKKLKYSKHHLREKAIDVGNTAIDKITPDKMDELKATELAKVVKDMVDIEAKLGGEKEEQKTLGMSDLIKAVMGQLSDSSLMLEDNPAIEAEFEEVGYVDEDE